MPAFARYVDHVLALICCGFAYAASSSVLAGDNEDLYAAIKRAEAFHDKADLASAAREYQFALRLAPKVFGQQDRNTATLLNRLALVYVDMARYKEAEAFFGQSLAIRETTLGPRHAEVAASLCNIGLLYKQAGEYSKAESAYRRSLQIYDAVPGNSQSDTADCCEGLGVVCTKLGNYSAAEPLLRRSLKIREGILGSRHPKVAFTLLDLANLYKALNQFANAESLYQRSITILDAAKGTSHPDTARSRVGLGNLYCQTGQHAKALPLYETSLKSMEATYGPRSPVVAGILNNLANAHGALGHNPDAAALYERSLQIDEFIFGVEHLAVAAALNNLGMLYEKMQRFAVAEPLLLRSYQIRLKNLGPAHSDVVQSADNIAGLYFATGQYNKTSEWCDRARRFTRNYVTSLLPVLNEHEQLTFMRAADQERFYRVLSFARIHRDSAEINALSAGWVLNGKAVVLESVADRQLLARDSKDPAVAAQVRQLRQMRAELAGLSRIVPKAAEAVAHRQRLVELSRQEQEIARQADLTAGRPAFGDSWVEVSAVRTALPKDALFIDVVRFLPAKFGDKAATDRQWESPHYVTWLTPSAERGDVRIVDLGEAEEIERAVAAVREGIEKSASQLTKADDEPRAQQATLQPLAALAKLVLDPLKPHLTGIKRLILSPDAELWLAPWAALPIGDDKYIIEEYEVRFVTSGRELVYERLQSQSDRKRQTSRPRVFADPDYNLDGKASLAATRAVLRGKENQFAIRGTVARSESGLMKVQRLPGTADEARLIAPSLQFLTHEAPTVYSEQYALEGVLKAIESPKVLVLSTHGFYLPDQEVKSDDRAADIVATDGDKTRSALIATDGKPLENPLLRCGLLLAGCNQPPSPGVDDGVLTGMEIVECDLRGTDLVVLSACETGLGQVRNGEGVAGLRQAFQLAGAKAVVSTLWRIPDRETAVLMNDFFTGLASGKTKAAALRDAQLALIRQHRHDTGVAHPIYWAAFTVTGN